MCFERLEHMVYIVLASVVLCLTSCVQRVDVRATYPMKHPVEVAIGDTQEEILRRMRGEFPHAKYHGVCTWKCIDYLNLVFCETGPSLLVHFGDNGKAQAFRSLEEAKYGIIWDNGRIRTATEDEVNNNKKIIVSRGMSRSQAVPSGLSGGWSRYVFGQRCETPFMDGDSWRHPLVCWRTVKIPFDDASIRNIRDMVDIDPEKLCVVDVVAEKIYIVSRDASRVMITKEGLKFKCKEGERFVHTPSRS